MVEQLDISPNQDGAILKEVKRTGEDPNDKPWKGDRVSVVSPNQRHIMYLATKQISNLRKILKFMVIKVRQIEGRFALLS